ncbi:MAG: hypothetical protein NZ824_12245 [Candidatus Thioglobus sp.]|nr:hypothetical protein [Candidatus Thioglobus sp.]
MGKKSAYVPPPPVDYAAEAKARDDERERLDQELTDERTELLNKKKSGRYSLLLTGGEGVQDEAETSTKSLLG